MSLAFMTGRQEFVLGTVEKDFDGMTEAEFLAKSIKDVSDHYKVEWLDKKSIDWANLMQALFIVYGGRIIAIRANPRPRAPAPMRGATAANPAQTMNAAQANGPIEGFDAPTERDTRTADIAGMGAVEFPPDHPLVARKDN